MAIKIVGRDAERSLLDGFLSSGYAEFLAIYGRRRVGKTFLIGKTFERATNIVFFDVTGSKDAPMAEQIKHFTQQVGQVFYGYQRARLIPGKNWDEAFDLLTDAIESVEGGKKIVLFFDEFPWMVTKNSRLLQCLDYYWNQHWSKNNMIKLIICGSSATWIVEKIINNKGGLHNRITRRVFLQPFKLAQVKSYLNSISVRLTQKQILELFMTMGGIPFYLQRVSKNLSATQIIEQLAFKRNSFLLEEFTNMYAALFDQADIYVEIVKEIAAHRYGIGQEELLNKLGASLKGAGGLDKLKALQDAGFIKGFRPLYHKRRGIYYRVIDQYTLFYFYWIAPVKSSLLQDSLLDGYWDKLKIKPAWHSWAGLSFEAVCYEHLPQIVAALNLSPTAIPGAWRYVPKKGSSEQGAQIDLLFDRDDDAITLCEIKYCDKPFVITKEYAQKLRNRVKVFKRITRTTKQIFIVFIAANGVKKNIYYDEFVAGVVTLSDLFRRAN